MGVPGTREIEDKAYSGRRRNLRSLVEEIIVVEKQVRLDDVHGTGAVPSFPGRSRTPLSLTQVRELRGAPRHARPDTSTVKKPRVNSRGPASKMGWITDGGNAPINRPLRGLSVRSCESA